MYSSNESPHSRPFILKGAVSTRCRGQPLPSNKDNKVEVVVIAVVVECMPLSTVRPLSKFPRQDSDSTLPALASAPLQRPPFAFPSRFDSAPTNPVFFTLNRRLIRMIRNPRLLLLVAVFFLVGVFYLQSGESAVMPAAVARGAELPREKTESRDKVLPREKKAHVADVGDVRVKSDFALADLQALYMHPLTTSLPAGSGPTAFIRTANYPAVRTIAKSSQKRILVTGGAGFVGSHLVDRLMLMGHYVIVMDNLFTGARENIEHWMGHPNFEFARHDVVGGSLLFSKF